MSDEAKERAPHPLNVPGVFYVEDECCTRCDVPIGHAPDLFAASDHESCYVKHQPATSEQLKRMLEVIQCAELQCIRYRGSDRQVQSRIAELGMGDVCDSLPDDLRAISNQVQVAQRERLRSRKALHTGGQLRRWSNWLYRSGWMIWIVFLLSFIAACLLGLVIRIK
ncbi:MAG TPA: ferredoxin [Planctomycetaceae bacterium]|nr:ferredoxin [Planctomycetaceae bacterium]